MNLFSENILISQFHLIHILTVFVVVVVVLVVIATINTLILMHLFLLLSTSIIILPVKRISLHFG